MVPVISIVCMCISVLIVAVLAVGLPIFIKKKWNTAVSPYFIGCAVFIVFVIILESIMHNIVFTLTGDAITGNMWLYALYGGFAAGIFEETGRLIAMKTVMKKHRTNDCNALMYGAGHGGCEAVILVGVTLVAYVILAIMLNAGKMDTILADLPDTQKEAMQLNISRITETAPYMLLGMGFERITAVMLHIALSAVVWVAVVRSKIGFYFLAILLHAVLDGALVIMQQSGVNYIVLEITLFAVSLGIAILACFIWKKQLADRGEQTTNE